MSFETLANDPLTVVHMGNGPPDEYNNSPRVELSRERFPGYVEQTEAREIQTGRDTTLADWLAVIRRNESGKLPVLTAFDQIIAGGITYEVVGPPAYKERPGSGIHHVEAQMRVFA